MLLSFTRKGGSKKFSWVPKTPPLNPKEALKEVRENMGKC